MIILYKDYNIFVIFKKNNFRNGKKVTVTKTTTTNPDGSTKTEVSE